MSSLSVSPFYLPVLIAVAITTAALIVSWSKFYRDTIFAEGIRYGYLDGLRGYLAVCVVATHLFSSYNWHLTGRWEYPESIVYRLASSAPVSIFFMITAFLFWGKIVRSKNSLDWCKLFQSRFYRLTPLYLACIPLLLFFIGIETKWVLREPLLALWVSISRWVGLGILGAPAVNGFSQTFALHPAIWTLRYEWLFYLSLPVVAGMFKLKHALILGTIISSLAIYFEIPVIYNFVLGGAAVYIVGDKRLNFLKSKLAGIVAGLSIFLMAFNGLYAYGIMHSLLLFPLFLAVCQGNDLFGALSNRSALMLGLVSYSIYLVHMLIVHGLFFLIGFYISLDNQVLMSVMVPLIGSFVVLVSSLTFRYVEYPWLNKSTARRGVSSIAKSP